MPYLFENPNNNRIYGYYKQIVSITFKNQLKHHFHDWRVPMKIRFLLLIFALMVIAILLLSLVLSCGRNTKIVNESLDEKCANLNERTVLTLATIYPDNSIRNAVSQFNMTNSKYYIQLIQYSDSGTGDNLHAGYTSLTTEIVSGKVPDIICLDGLPYKHYVAKGLLEDIYQFIDTDTQLTRGDLMERVFEAAEIDGKLYQVFPSFHINTLFGNPSIVGEDTGWNMDEFEAVLNANPDADIPMGPWSKSHFIISAVMSNFNEFVDWDAGEVYFDTEHFSKLLEFASMLPLDYKLFGEYPFFNEYDLIFEGRQIMVRTYVSDFSSLQIYRALFGGEIVFKGFPTEDRRGSHFSFNSSLAITTKCVDKSGAWEFIRMVLEKNWQLENIWAGLPTNKAAFDLMLEEAMIQKHEMLYWNRGTDLEINALSQKEAEQLLALIDTGTGFSSWDETILKIVLEGADDYFSGRSSIKDALNVIQRRATIYVSELS